MTNQEINIAIAKVCGWTFGEPSFTHAGRWEVRFGNPPYSSDSKWAGEPPSFEECYKNYSLLPNYCEDLNAMHAAENGLNNQSKAIYREKLCIVTLNNGGPIHATASQRSEAFLRTLNLWKD